MTLKAKRTLGTQEESCFFQGIFLKEAIFHKLSRYSMSTQKEESEIINEVLEEFFAQARKAQ